MTLLVVTNECGDSHAGLSRFAVMETPGELEAGALVRFEADEFLSCSHWL